MTAASNSEARKRTSAPVDPVEVVARVLWPTVCTDRYACSGCSRKHREAQAAVAALRAEGLLP